MRWRSCAARRALQASLCGCRSWGDIRRFEEDGRQEHLNRNGRGLSFGVVSHGLSLARVAPAIFVIPANGRTCRLRLDRHRARGRRVVERDGDAAAFVGFLGEGGFECFRRGDRHRHDRRAEAHRTAALACRAGRSLQFQRADARQFGVGAAAGDGVALVGQGQAIAGVAIAANDDRALVVGLAALLGEDRESLRRGGRL
ncbi:hypothetical protein WR25_19080 [Diploscapter pachys]|uniref:Uncharacterized protein n=1 Tax=Diploscapter pachys TaxID=2018661 RepID=A0A2A2M4G9_9BILA|nr:hypothetical protein WR25_19080 [Diploscapter pachys]